MSKTAFSRREIIRRVGPAALLMIPVLRARDARAAAQPGLITVFYGNGASCQSIDQMFPARVGTGWDWSMTIVPALAPFGASMSLARGLQIYGGIRPKGAHVGAAVSCLTGTPQLNRLNIDDHTPQQASIDVWYEKQTKLRKVHAGVMKAGPSSSWEGNDIPTKAETDPRRAYQTFFGSFDPTMVTGAPSADRAQLDRMRARKRYVLDLLVQDVVSAKRILGLDQSERQRLERYETSLHEIENQLRKESAPAAPSPAGKPPAVQFGSGTAGVTKAFLDTFAAAIALGATRSCSIHLGGSGRSGDYAFAGGPSSHHADQHAGQTEKCRKATTWVHGQVAHLLAQLKSYPTGDGKDALFHSVVLVGTDFLDGVREHGYAAPHPTFVFGNASGKLKGNVDARSNRHHNEVLATIAQALTVTGDNPFAKGRFFEKPIAEWLA